MEGALGGIKNALSIAQGIDTADAEKARADLYRRQTQGVNLDIAAKQSAAEQARVLQDDINNVVRTPSTEGITSLMLKYPHLSEGFNRGLNAVSTEEQKARVQEGTQIYAAILNDKIDVAKTILTDTATALRDKGNAKQAETYERMAQLIELNPDGSETTIGMMLSTAMGPEQFRATFKELEDQRRLRRGERAAQRKGVAEANEAESKAATAAVTAKFAESNATIDLKKKGWDITKLQNDVALSKLNQKIATLTAEESRATSTARREKLELEAQKLRDERDAQVRDRAAGLAQSTSNIDNMLNSLEGILNSKALNDVVGPIEGSDFYPTTLASMAARGINITNPFHTPTSADERRTTIAQVDKLVAQSFVTQLEKMRGLGHLSDVEGTKIQAAFENFTRSQGEEGFRTNAQEARRLLLKERARLSQKYGVPNGPVDTPKAPGSRPPLGSFDR
jgi:hypothetical protein